MTRRAQHTRRGRKTRRGIKHESSVRPDRVALRSRWIHAGRETEANPLTASVSDALVGQISFARHQTYQSGYVSRPIGRPHERTNS
jgi:hypothetical protein